MQTIAERVAGLWEKFREVNFKKQSCLLIMRASMNRERYKITQKVKLSIIGGKVWINEKPIGLAVEVLNHDSGENYNWKREEQIT